MNEEEMLNNITNDVLIHEWDVSLNEYILKNIDKVLLKKKRELQNAIMRSKQEIELLQTQHEILTKKSNEVKPE